MIIFAAIVTGAMLMYIFHRVSGVAGKSLEGQEPADLFSLVQTLDSVAYFRKLSTPGKKRFASRVHTFLLNIGFKGMHGLEITDTIRVSIAASAVQLTFGLKEFLFTGFGEIYVYPGPFFVEALGQELRGGVSPDGMIFISWSTFQDDNRKGTDGINLGLHEMAHVLKISASEGSFDKAFSERFAGWIDMSEKMLEDIPAELATFLRGYGFTNPHEFFSVCVEQFFEQPGAFSEHVPELYAQLRYLLNQDPLQFQHDYRIIQ
jgi:Mlc titration factor MtfA (ptsG expression regulator)